MIKALSITLILLTFISCTDQRTVEEKWENGKTKRILDFQNISDSIFTEKLFNDQGELTKAISHNGSILNGDWISYKNNIKFTSGELINGQYNRSKVTWYYENGSIETERYYNDKGNVYQEIGYYKDHHLREVLFLSNEVKRNQFKQWYGWFPNGNLQYVQDTLIFPNSFNEWDVNGNKIK